MLNDSMSILDRIFNVLRRIKRCFNWLALPDSAAILKYEQEKIRRKVYILSEKAQIVLDIGAGNRPVMRFKRVISMDYAEGHVDIRADAHCLPFSERVFDLVWLGGVLEHIRNPQTAIQEAGRVLKGGGYIYLEIPFFQRVHAAPCDFQRFTIAGLEELCSRFSKIESGVLCGPSSAFSHVLRTYLSLCLSFNSRSLFHFFYYYILGWVTMPLKYCDIILSKYNNAETIALGFYYLGKKM